MQQILKSQLATEFTALCKQRKRYLTVIQVGLYQRAFKTGLYIPDIITVLEREKIWALIEDNNLNLHKKELHCLPFVLCKAWFTLKISVLTAMTLTKSFSPSVSRMVLMVCFAIVSLKPFMLPLMSTTMMMSLGDVAAWMYLRERTKQKCSLKWRCRTVWEMCF